MSITKKESSNTCTKNTKFILKEIKENDVLLYLSNDCEMVISGECANCIPTIQYLYHENGIPVKLQNITKEYMVGIEAFIHSNILKCHFRTGKVWSQYVHKFSEENMLKMLFLHGIYLDIYQLIPFVTRVISIRLGSLKNEDIFIRYKLHTLKDAEKLKKYCNIFLRTGNKDMLDKITYIFRNSILYKKQENSNKRPRFYSKKESEGKGTEKEKEENKYKIKKAEKQKINTKQIESVVNSLIDLPQWL